VNKKKLRDSSNALRGEDEEDGKRLDYEKNVEWQESSRSSKRGSGS